MDGGLGSVRFDKDDSTLQLGRARFALTQSLGETWSAHLDASVWDDNDAHPLGVTEAYLQFRPYPHAGYRLRVKAGAFYAPISLENRTSGWESPYTLSYSAINSWLATEVRTLGAEAQLDWLGSRMGHAFDLSVVAAVFGWNDQAGTVIAGDGFVLTDRQTNLGARVGQPGSAPLDGTKPFLETDGRPGGYAGLEARYLDRLTLRVLRYDNRADPSEINAVAHVVAWHTTFTSAGARLETQGGWTAIAQWLDGKTADRPRMASRPRGRSVPASACCHAALGRHTFSARYDRFWVDTQGTRRWLAKRSRRDARPTCSRPAPTGTSSSSGCASRSDSYNRADLYGGSPWATQTQVQLAVRYALGSQLR